LAEGELRPSAIIAVIRRREMFIILTWLDIPDVSLVLNKDGLLRVFATHVKAEQFAESELAFNWKIVEL
jgi:hypothetical protein